MESVILQGLVASLIAGLVTGLGGLMVFLKKTYSKDNIDMMLNVAAGVMISAAFFTLLAPSMEEIKNIYVDIHMAGFAYVGAIFLGVALLLVLNAIFYFGLFN